MEEKAQTTHSTGYTQDCSVKIPEPEITTDHDSMVRIKVGDKVGWVSSYHLVVPKTNQLINAWLAKHNNG